MFTDGTWLKAADDIIRPMPFGEWLREACPSLFTDDHVTMHGTSWLGRDKEYHRLSVGEGEPLPIDECRPGLDAYAHNIEVNYHGSHRFGEPLFDHESVIREELVGWFKMVELHLWDELGDNLPAALVTLGPPRFIEADGIIHRNWGADRFYATVVWYGTLVPFRMGPLGSSPITADMKPKEANFIGQYEATVDPDPITGTVVIRDDEFEIAGMIGDLAELKKRFVREHP